MQKIRLSVCIHQRKKYLVVFLWKESKVFFQNIPRLAANLFLFTNSHHLCAMQVSFRSQIARVVHIRAGYVWVVLARHFLLISQTAELIKNPTAWTNFNCVSSMSCRHAKGQIKPKADWRAVDSPRKMNKQICLCFL